MMLTKQLHSLFYGAMQLSNGLKLASVGWFLKESVWATLMLAQTVNGSYI
jgi:hypothetical protein